jgi:hypothetical protein
VSVTIRGVGDISPNGDCMRSIPLHSIARALFAAFVLVMLSTYAWAQTAGPGPGGGGASGGGASGGGAAGGGAAGGGATGGGSSGGAAGGGSSGGAAGGGSSGGAAGGSSGASGHGAAPIFSGGGDPSEACGSLGFPPPSAFGDGGDAVKALSRVAQSYITKCRCDSRQCIADALDRYAEALAVVAPRLPKELQETPAIVARAARRVRTARTKAEAERALREAIAVIHKDVSLVRAEDPDSLKRETRGGEFVIDTLNVASVSLEKASGL